MKSPLQLIREKVIEVVPEVMELKFGCEIRYEPSSYMGINYRGTYLHEARGKNKHLLYFPGSDEGSQSDYSTTIDEKDFKIIGRPILPQDILSILPHDWVLKGIDGRFEFILMTDYGTKKFENKYILWSPGSLDNQDEPTLKFLAEILK